VADEQTIVPAKRKLCPSSGQWHHGPPCPCRHERIYEDGVCLRFAVDGCNTGVNRG
jgi:hypothetical protein